jgi:hypothetical protein
MQLCVKLLCVPAECLLLLLIPADCLLLLLICNMSMSSNSYSASSPEEAHQVLSTAAESPCSCCLLLTGPALLADLAFSAGVAQVLF